jgi:transposase-like protein
MLFRDKKVKCVFCKRLTRKKKAFTINMNTAEGLHKSYACPECSKDFDELAQHMEKNIDKRTFTI